jgi:cellulose synthase/poly-beta-1,6-N-acetylglucosamine synthase-like glycosyltransferase
VAREVFPTVSVIMPVYNGAATIGECIRSLLRVEYPKDRLEVIVVDNASTDGTRLALEGCRDQIRVLNQAKVGPAAARHTPYAMPPESTSASPTPTAWSRAVLEEVGRFFHCRAHVMVLTKAAPLASPRRPFATERRILHNSRRWLVGPDRFDSFCEVVFDLGKAAGEIATLASLRRT